MAWMHGISCSDVKMFPTKASTIDNFIVCSIFWHSKEVVSKFMISFRSKVLKVTSIILVLRSSFLTNLLDMALVVAPLSNRAYVGSDCPPTVIMTETIGRETILPSYADASHSLSGEGRLSVWKTVWWLVIPHLSHFIPSTSQSRERCPLSKHR